MVQNIKLLNNVQSKNLPLSTTDTDYYILDSVDWGVITASHQQYKYIGQYGVTIVGTTLGTRDVEIKGWVIARTEQEMTERKKFLNAFFNPLHSMTLLYSGYSLDFYCQKTIKYGSEHKENNEVICHWVVDGIAPDPFFKGVSNSRYYASRVTGAFMFPLILKDNHRDSLVFGKIKTATIFSAYNTGHIPTGFKVTFFARGGDVTNPALLHVGKQQFIKINKVLTQGESVVIDTNKESRSVTGIIDNKSYNYYMYKDLDSTWITLDVGDNMMNYSADAGMDLLDVTIDFNYKYEEVQECY